MKEMLVVVFPDEKAASAGSIALMDLHAQGDIALHAWTVIVRASDGRLKMREGRDRRPLGMLIGMVCGGLIGGIGGPISAIACAFVGLSGGLVYDLFSTEFDSDILDKVGALLEPGSSSVIADLDETGTTPLETVLAAYGGRVLRQTAEKAPAAGGVTSLGAETAS